MGTVLETHGPVLIRGAEHWCQAFHNWVCAGIAVRDVVTREPIAVLNISCWRSQLPASAGGWLANAVTKTQCTLRRRAQDSGAELVVAYTQAGARSRAPLAAMDTAGKVVGLPELIGAARYAGRQVAHNPDSVGSAQIFTHSADEPTSISIRPVFFSGHLIGNLVSFGTSVGAQLPQAEGSAHPRVHPRRLIAMRDNRMVLLRLPEVSFAESEGNDVWLYPPIKGDCEPPLRAWTTSTMSWRMSASCGCTAGMWSTSAASGRSSAGSRASCFWSWATGRTTWCRFPGGTRRSCAALDICVPRHNLCSWKDSRV
jgi:hypothetical protein